MNIPFPVDRAQQRSAFDKVQSMSIVQEPRRQVSPVFQERPGPKFSSLADVPVVYCDSDDESSESNYRSSGVRVEVKTTDELLDEVRNSVEDISLENIQSGFLDERLTVNLNMIFALKSSRINVTKDKS